MLLWTCPANVDLAEMKIHASDAVEQVYYSPCTICYTILAATHKVNVHAG